MSSRAAGGETDAERDDRYTPISRLEDRSQRIAELLVVVVAVAGFLLGGDRLGVIAGLVLLGCWLFLQVEFTFTVGAVLVAAVGGAPTSLGTVLAVAGLCGLLAVDLARAWASVRPVALFLALLVAAALAFVVASRSVGIHWMGLGAAVTVAAASYGLHRSEGYAVRSTAGGASDRRSEPTPDVEEGGEAA